MTLEKKMGLLLCGGKGTRMYPFNLEYRKVDLLVNGKTVLQRQKEFLEHNGVPAFHQVLGTDGTAGDARAYITGNADYVILNGDTLYNFDLRKMLSFHERKNALCTINVARTDVPHEKGIVLLGINDQVIDFTEKPEHPQSDLSWGGVIICDSRIRQYFPKKTVVDWAKDVFPSITQGFYGYRVSDDQYLDVGTLKGYERAILYYRKKEGNRGVQ